jgi:chromosome segregation ATPase
VKTINGSPIKPEELLVFIDTYVENFKNDSTPGATSIYEATLDKQFRILIAKSVDIYIQSVSTHDAEMANENDIKNVHKTAKDKALIFFNAEKKFGSYSESMNFKKELNAKIEEIYQQWSSVSLAQLKQLQAQKAKTNDQINKIQTALVNDERVKEELRQAILKADEARIALENAKTDTEEARREAEELKKKSEQAEKDRAAAMEEVRQSREYYEKLLKDKNFFEQEYQKLKEQSAANVGSALQKSERTNGFLGTGFLIVYLN